MNRVHLATTDEEENAEKPDRDPPSALRASRATAEPKPERSIGGAFAGLKKLFGREH